MKVTARTIFDPDPKRFAGAVFMLLFSLALAGHLRAQGDCSNADLMTIKGSWRQRPDASMQYSKDQPKMIRYLDSIRTLFQTAYPEPKGIEAGWYRSMNNPLFPGAPTAYNFTSLYMAWYCNTNMHKLLVSGETGTWAYVFVNSFGWLISDQYDKSAITIDDATVYFLPPKLGTWKGYDLYQPTAHARQGRCILLTHGNRLPWKLLSQEQYLKALRSFYAGVRDKALSASVNMSSDAVARLRKAYDDNLLPIDTYLSNTSPAILQQPAILAPNARDRFQVSFSTEEKGGRLVATIDRDYFARQSPGYLPQLMVLYWRWDNNPPAQYFKHQFEADFPVEKLQAMIDSGRPPASSH